MADSHPGHASRTIWFKLCDLFNPFNSKTKISIKSGDVGIDINSNGLVPWCNLLLLWIRRDCSVSIGGHQLSAQNYFRGGSPCHKPNRPFNHWVNHQTNQILSVNFRAGLGTVGIVVGITLLTYLNFFDITKVINFISDLLNLLYGRVYFLVQKACERGLVTCSLCMKYFLSCDLNFF